MNHRGLAVKGEMPGSLIFVAMALSVLVWVPGCINPQQVDLLERDQRRLRADMRTLQGDVDGFRATLADTRANMQQMQRDVSAIKARIDETRVQVGRQIGQTSREGDERVKTLESRLASLEEEAKIQAEDLDQLLDAARAAEQRAMVYDGYAAIALGESEPVRKSYESAWLRFERKDYRAAVSRFGEFLKKYPRSRLAPAAQFWLGESYFAMKDFEKAIVAYDEVRRYPQTDKIAAALLRQGIAFAELGEKLNARLVLQELVEKFPQSAEAPRAKQRLKALES